MNNEQLGEALEAHAEQLAQYTPDPFAEAVRETVEGLHKKESPKGPEKAGKGVKVDKEGLPKINAKYRNLREMSAKGWDALAGANDPPVIFVFGSEFVRLNRDEDGVLESKRLGKNEFRHILGRAADWYSINKQGKSVTDLPPVWLVEDMLVESSPRLPYLRRIVSHPVFTADSDLHLAPGYSQESRCYYHSAEKLSIPDVPDKPTKSELSEAIKWIQSPLCDFPFVSPSEKAHLIALMLLPFVRDMIAGCTPLHITEAPSVGSGKSLCACIAGYPALGSVMPIMTEGQRDGEWGKRITSMLMKNPEFVLIDNVKRKLESGDLSAVLTALTWEDRLLGTNKIARLPVRCAWVATGNNIALSTEIARRSIRIRLDPKMDQPWTRKPEEFKYPNILQWCHDHRPQLVWSCLITIQAWIAAGKPEPAKDIPVLGSFEDWTRVMGGILEVAGIEGFLGNLDEFYRASDTEGETLRAFVQAWYNKFVSNIVNVKDLFELITEDDIPLYLGQGKTDQGQKVYLGRQVLNSIRDRQFGDFKVVHAGKLRRIALWKLELISPAFDSPSTQNAEKGPASTHISTPSRPPSTHDKNSTKPGDSVTSCVEVGVKCSVPRVNEKDDVKIYKDNTSSAPSTHNALDISEKQELKPCVYPKTSTHHLHTSTHRCPISKLEPFEGVCNVHTADNRPECVDCKLCKAE